MNKEMKLLPTQFKLHLLSRLISCSGDIISSIATMLFVLHFTDSYIWAGLNLTVSFLPQVLFSPFAGNICDEKDCKKVMIICDCINAVLAFLLAIVVIFQCHIFILFSLTFLMNTCDTFHSIAGQSFVKRIVDQTQYIVANASLTSTLQIATIIFTSLGGFLSQLLGYSMIFVINALSFILSAIIKMFISYSHTTTTNESGVLKEKAKKQIIQTAKTIYLSYRYIFFSFIVLGAIINFLLAPTSLYMPVYISDYLLLNESWYGILLIMIPIGNLFYSLIATKIVKRIKEKRIIFLSFCLEGIALIFWGLSTNFIFASLSLIFLGFSLSMASINLSSYMQTYIPDNIYGKVIGIGSSILGICVPLGFLFGSVILTFISIHSILIVSGILIIIFTFSFAKKSDCSMKEEA